MTKQLQRQTEKPAAKRGLVPFKTGAVHCSADTPDSYRDVVNQSLVLRINPAEMRDGKNRHLLVAAKR